MKQFILAVLFFALTTLTYGQEPLTGSDFVNTYGTEFSLFSAPAMDPGGIGTDQTWDFTEIPSGGYSGVALSDPDEALGSYLFPDGNSVWDIEYESQLLYYHLSDDVYAYLGQYQPGGYEMVYTNPFDYIQFPLTYEQAYVDSFEIDYDFPNADGHILGQADVIVDGYGTLILPIGEIENAYRTTYTVSQTEVFTNAGGTYTAYFSGTTHMWFAPGFPGAIVTIRNGTLSIPQLNYTQDQSGTQYIGDYEFVGVDEVEIVEALSVAPNPAKEFISLHFSKEFSEALTISIVNITGQKLKSLSGIAKGVGSVTQKIDISDLPAGLYMLTLESEKGRQSTKIIVE